MKNYQLQILKLSFWLLALLLSLVSCQSDTEQPNPNPEPEPLGKLLLKKDFGFGDMHTFEYNAHNQLIKFKSTTVEWGESYTTYEYVNTTDRRLKKMILENGMFYQYEYEGNRLQKVKFLAHNNTLMGHYEYSYNAENQLIKIEYKGANSNTGDSKFTYRYNTQGNMIEEKFEQYNLDSQHFETITITTFEDFDDKKNVESWLLIYPNIPHIVLHKNNPRKSTIRGGQGELINQSIATFTYDAQGYPTKTKIVSEQGEGPLTLEYSLTYK